MHFLVFSYQTQWDKRTQWEKVFKKLKLCFPQSKNGHFLLKNSYFNYKQGYNFFCLDLPLLGFGTFQHLYLSDKNMKKLVLNSPAYDLICDRAHFSSYPNGTPEQILNEIKDIWYL